MTNFKFLCKFIVLVTLFSTTKCSNQNHVIQMNINYSHHENMVYDEEIICTKPYVISIRRIWSTAYIEIKSNQTCRIYTGINHTNIEETRKQLNSIFNQIMSKFKLFQEYSDEPCHSNIIVQLYKTNCIAVKLKGNLIADYKYISLDFKLLAIFLTGFLLFYSSKMLSKNSLFYYFSGVSLGVLGSVVLMIFILWRFIPKKTTAFLTLTTCSSLFVFMARWFYSNFKELGESLQNYIYGYIALSAFVSLTYCYYRGPIQNARAINIVEYILKIAGVLFIYNGTSYREISISIIIAFFLVNLCYELRNLEGFTMFKKIRTKYFPAKRRLLTLDEYNKEAHEYTQKALQELKDYCISPECDKWKIVSRISKPDRFAKFISNNDSHLIDDELFEYEKYSISTDLIDDEDDDDENEM